MTKATIQELSEEIVYHNTFPIQLRFFDADQFGHINNSIFFQYYDTAKMDYLQKVCPDLGRKYAVVTVHLEANFLSQVYTNDQVAVQTAVTHIGTKSFTLSQRLIDLNTQQVKCEGKTIMVAFDLEKRESIPFLPEWIEALNRYEGRDLRTAK